MGDMSGPLLANANSSDFSLAKQVMEYVRSAVMSGKMKPGELYSVIQLAEQLQVSRSPVRDGLLRLEEAGLIRFERNRGFRVVPTTPNDVAEIFALRIAIESAAARRSVYLGDIKIQDLTELANAMRSAAAADDEELFFQLDRELHDVIMTAARAKRAREIVERLRISTRLMGASTVPTSRTYEDICKEHDPIIEAIARGDALAAGKAMETHLVTTGKLLVKQALIRTGGDEDPEELWRRLTQGVVPE